MADCSDMNDVYRCLLQQLLINAIIEAGISALHLQAIDSCPPIQTVTERLVLEIILSYIQVDYKL